MSIQQSLNAALTTSAALYTQSAGYKERQIQKLGKFAEAKEEEFSKKFAEIRPKIVKAQANLEKSKQKQEELNKDIEEIEKLENFVNNPTYKAFKDNDKLEELNKIYDKLSKKGYKKSSGSAKEEIAAWKKQNAKNLKRAKTTFFKAKNELDELMFKRNLYRNLYGGAR